MRVPCKALIEQKTFNLLLEGSSSSQPPQKAHGAPHAFIFPKEQVARLWANRYRSFVRPYLFNEHSCTATACSGEIRHV